jgi:anti-sigma B factor antagonist
MAGLDANSTTDMTVDLVEGEDGALTVRLGGELDITNVGTLASAVAPALERGVDRLIVDVGDVRFADSSAIALWVRWATVVPEIELRAVPPLLRRVIDSMGLSDTLRVAS